MYENITYESLLKSMLAVVIAKNANVDTREGSLVWYGQAPSAVELQNLYIQLDTILNETFADTASRPYLILRAAERGLTPYSATKAICKGEFTPTTLELATGTRFSLNDLNYKITEKISNGVYKLQCETEGEKGNEYVGTLIPVEYINGLETAQLTEILIPGEDEEDTEVFRQRYFDSLDAQAFGGNVADYKEKVNAISGVGGVKVYREWNGNIKPADLALPTDYATWYASLTDVPAAIQTWLAATSTAAQDGLLTVGGCIRLVVIDSTFSKPSMALVDLVQETIDPASAHAEGLGLAPIGHFVTVEGVNNTAVNIAVTITYQSGWTWDDVKSYAQSAIDAYLLGLSKGWANSNDPLVVRISGIETTLLACPGVVDVAGTTINGTAANLILGANNIPIRGELNG
ncbi:baseplate J/gp47 family protein [Oscillibacter sp.]|uniref:baseplate J/gp47 family protein n=1 Tax=Oscillibacter sp. TaxID=1945593 RepID=UPI00263A179E|nr:baseplate J/gp47 family protein [Oscillibacter sp.]MDD3347329.1 baseplate J/gp47 family protein [Oscillibacter sp.]